VGNPAEKRTATRSFIVTFLQRFVNKFPFTSKLSFLAFLGFTTPIFTIYGLLLPCCCGCPKSFRGLRPSSLIPLALIASLQAPPQKMCHYLPKLL